MRPPDTPRPGPVPTDKHCWNSIGVHGDGSCPELQQYVHCRNCPAYAQAALELLNHETTDQYIKNWTHHVAAAIVVEQREAQSVMVFRIGAEWLGLPIHTVAEVTDIRPIHSLPHRANRALLGLANVRGELLVCMSLGRLLGLEEAIEPARRQRLIHPRMLVICRDQVRAVCPVDEVHGIHRIDPRQLKDVPSTVAGAAATYAKAVMVWGERSVGLVDDQLLFNALQRSMA